jgi:acetylglutamate kinase
MIASLSAKTEVLIEALPYISRYEGKTFVVKYGGAAQTDDELKETFAQDVTLLTKIGIRVVIVHGGGKEVTEVAGKLGLESRFIDGQRYTDAAMMDVVQMVLAGKTNKDIVGRINRHDGNAVGLSGVDANLLRVRKYEEGGVDLGFVGEICGVNVHHLTMLLKNGIMPVIAPVGVSGEGEAYNVNADVAASAVAAALEAEKLVFLSDVEGVMAGGALVPSMDQDKADRMMATRIISNGMVPKIRSAFTALNAGVNKVHLIDGRIKHSLLLEIFTDMGIGTELVHRSEHAPVHA